MSFSFCITCLSLSFLYKGIAVNCSTANVQMFAKFNLSVYSMMYLWTRIPALGVVIISPI